MGPFTASVSGFGGLCLGEPRAEPQWQGHPNTNSVPDSGFCEVQLVRGWLFASL